MKITALHLENFRSYERLSLPLGDSDLHLFIGANGAGKTNLLEAISVLSLTRSFLGAEEADLLQWNAEFYRVRAELTGWGDTTTVEVVSQLVPRVQKACFLRDVRSPVERIVGVLPTVVFLPQDLELFSGAPALRRRFIDRLLCQVSPSYLHALAQYQRVLKQRNGLLRRIGGGGSDSADLAVWDQFLAEHGSVLTLQRLELLETLQLTLAEEVHSLGESWADIQLTYDRTVQAREEAGLREEYCRRLQEARSKDLALLSTTVGPHREDWHVLVAGRELSTFASRGQQRTVLLALLLLQVSYLELRVAEKPVILLDDVFSELDDAHQTALLEALQGYQVLLTATRVPLTGAAHGCVWEVGGGCVIPVGETIEAA